MKQIFILISMIILLLSVAMAATIMPVKCDGSVATNEFEENESLCVYGVGFEANQDVDLFVVEDQNAYVPGQTLVDVTGSVESVQTTSKGILVIKNIWDKVVKGVYDIIADLNGNSRYDEGDIVNAANGAITVTGEEDSGEGHVEEVPEFSTFMAIVLLAGIGMFIQKKRRVKT